MSKLSVDPRNTVITVKFNTAEADALRLVVACEGLCTATTIRRLVLREAERIVGEKAVSVPALSGDQHA